MMRCLTGWKDRIILIKTYKVFFIYWLLVAGKQLLGASLPPSALECETGQPFHIKSKNQTLIKP